MELAVLEFTCVLVSIWMCKDPLTILGRVVAVADAFDALLSKRAYKDSFTLEDTLKSIDEGIGCYFDPDVVSALHRALPRLLEIRDQWIDPEFE